MKTFFIFALLLTSWLLCILFIIRWIEYDFDSTWDIYEKFVEELLK